MTAASKKIFGTGHASMVFYNEQWLLFYHRLVNPKLSKLREICCSPIQFNDGKPIVNVDAE
ncbi:hypothetical protein EHS13_24080 [Paenibacillus psychroresistens]|uniref:Uncharacterized protein n=2 Tax=Paenibacillus psychroresistens TaxID=1778678 RepID=A0A6B8RPK8_9BACL|nr:hypothetical protein EHS13_24080 [Paenibacillus psychroresistens]